jgi:hypothetical protein
MHPEEQSCCLGSYASGQSYNNDLAATAKHLQWLEAKVRAAVNYAEAFVDEIDQELDEYRALDFTAL